MREQYSSVCSPDIDISPVFVKSEDILIVKMKLLFVVSMTCGHASPYSYICSPGGAIWCTKPEIHTNRSEGALVCQI